MSNQEENKNLNLPKPFEAHPNLDDRLNKAIEESDLQGGVKLENLSVGVKVEVWTEHTRYLIEKRADGYYISGHPEFCPEPTKVVLIGSVWSSSTSIKNNFIGRGMNLQFRLPWQKNEFIEETGQISQPHIITSPIEDVRELSGPDDAAILDEYEAEVKEGVDDKKKDSEQK